MFFVLQIMIVFYVRNILDVIRTKSLTVIQIFCNGAQMKQSIFANNDFFFVILD